MRRVVYDTQTLTLEGIQSWRSGRLQWSPHAWRKTNLMSYSTVGCRRTWGRRSQPRSFLLFTTPANLVLIFQSVFESRWLACSTHTVGDSDACRAGNAAEMLQTVELESFRSQQCRRRSRLHSKRCLCVVWLFLQPGVVLIFWWNSSLAVLRQTVLRHPTVLYFINSLSFTLFVLWEEVNR